MSENRIRSALIAVYDKAGVAAFARALVEEFGVEIVSTGGTARHLQEAGVPVTLVEKVTGFPEMLDGRVKTLHPMIHAAILADRDNPGHMRQLAGHGITPIDMVVVNLYPFEATVARPGCRYEEAVEMIDIGGPCLLRAAAKNHAHVLVVPGKEFYADVLTCLRQQGADAGADGDALRALRAKLALHAFQATARYDIGVSAWLDRQAECQSPVEFLELHRLHATRYGENPHQQARVCRLGASSEATLVAGAGEVKAEAFDRGRVSFNNYLDGDAALALIKELTWASGRLRPQSGTARAAGTEGAPGLYAAAFIKHTNACGCAVGDDPVEVYRRAYLGDPIAAAGGVLCVNFPVTAGFAEAVMNSYGRWGRAAGAAFFRLDVWIAPTFEEEAVALITAPTEKRRWGRECRLLAVGSMDIPADTAEADFRKIAGGMLIQSRDLRGLDEDQWKVVSRRGPTEREMADLRFAWLVCKHTRSNAITICRDGMLLGNGAGQMSRVKSCDLAIQLARENGHGEKLAGAVAAGDAFFPVPDGPARLIEAGIRAIIHPGGSQRDAETIALADEHDVAMIITGTRHFKH